MHGWMYVCVSEHPAGRTGTPARCIQSVHTTLKDRASLLKIVKDATWPVGETGDVCKHIRLPVKFTSCGLLGVLDSAGFPASNPTLEARTVKPKH